jgi:hypothetical protein
MRNEDIQTPSLFLSEMSSQIFPEVSALNEKKISLRVPFNRRKPFDLAACRKNHFSQTAQKSPDARRPKS